MESSNQKTSITNSTNKLFDPLRRLIVKATPEELVRQNILKKMVHELGFPPHWIAVEKDLQQLPHHILSNGKVPKRRLDIVCYAKDQEGMLFPLLLIECKAISINPKTLQQVVSYNEFVQAHFVAVVNHQTQFIGHFDEEKGHYCFLEHFPPFCELMQKLACHAIL